MKNSRLLVIRRILVLGVLLVLVNLWSPWSHVHQLLHLDATTSLLFHEAPPPPPSTTAAAVTVAETLQRRGQLQQQQLQQQQLQHQQLQQQLHTSDVTVDDLPTRTSGSISSLGDHDIDWEIIQDDREDEKKTDMSHLTTKPVIQPIETTLSEPKGTSRSLDRDLSSSTENVRSFIDEVQLIIMNESQRSSEEVLVHDGLVNDTQVVVRRYSLEETANRSSSHIPGTTEEIVVGTEEHPTYAENLTMATYHVEPKTNMAFDGHLIKNQSNIQSGTDGNMSTHIVGRVHQPRMAIATIVYNGSALPDLPNFMLLDQKWHSKDDVDDLVESLARPFPTWNHSQPYAWCNNIGGMNDGILYVKLPKCASSTASGVALRVADTLGRRELNHDCNARFRHGWASKNDRQYGHRNKSTSFLWSLVREPSKRLLSHYFFEQVSRQGENATEEGVLDYLRGTSDMKKTFLLRYLKVFPYNDRAPSIMNETIRNYDFIGVTDRMDESLVVLSMLMRIPVADVIQLSSKVAGGYDAGRSGQGCVKLAPKRRFEGVSEFLKSQEWKRNNWDQIFYQIINLSLNKTIEEIGVDRVNRKLKRFRKLSKRAQEECLDEAIFPCPETLPNHTEQSKEDCYFSDGGCGHRCIDRVLGKDSDDEWLRMQRRLRRISPVFGEAMASLAVTSKSNIGETPVKALGESNRTILSHLAGATQTKVTHSLVSSAVGKSSQETVDAMFPPWLQKYIAFHRRSTDGGRVKEGVPYLVYQCYGGCAGLGGRIKAMVKSFYAAVCSDRVFLIDAPFPFPLQNYFAPDAIQWNASFPNETVTLPIFVRAGWLKNAIEIPENETGVRIKKAHGKRMLDLAQIWLTPTCRAYASMNGVLFHDPYDVEQMFYHLGSRVLFKFADNVVSRAEELKETAGLVPNRSYVGVHLRTGMGETWKEDALRLRRAQKSDNAPFVQCFHRFRDTYGFDQAYVAADNAAPKVELHSRDPLLKIATIESFHIDRSLSVNTTQGLAAIQSTGEDLRAGKNYNLYGGASTDMARRGSLDLYAELKILVDSECLIMTKSSLSFAALLMAQQPRCGVLVDDCTNETVKQRYNQYVVKTGKLEFRNISRIR